MKWVPVATTACILLLAGLLVAIIKNSTADEGAESGRKSIVDVRQESAPGGAQDSNSRGMPLANGVFDVLASIYGARDLRAQEAQARDTTGPLRYDASLLYAYGKTFCNYGKDDSDLTFVEVVQRTSSNPLPQTLASAKMLDAHRSRYCPAGRSVPENQQIASHEALAEAAAAGDVDAGTLLLMIERVFFSEMELNERERHLFERNAVDIAARTASPGLFLEAATLLADPAFSGWLPDGFGSRGVHEDDLQTIKYLAALMAMCDEFGVCSSHSIFTLRTCMPTQCDPRRGMEGSLRMRMNEEQYAHAQRYASALRAMRKS